MSDVGLLKEVMTNMTVGMSKIQYEYFIGGNNTLVPAASVTRSDSKL